MTRALIEKMEQLRQDRPKVETIQTSFIELKRLMDREIEMQVRLEVDRRMRVLFARLAPASQRRGGCCG